MYMYPLAATAIWLLQDLKTNFESYHEPLNEAVSKPSPIAVFKNVFFIILKSEGQSGEGLQLLNQNVS